MSEWTPINLRAADKSALLAALLAAGLAVDDDGETHPLQAGAHHRLLMLPPLSEPTGNVITDDDGIEYAETVPTPGCHANVLAHPDHADALKAALADVLIEPLTPMVGWAEYTSTNS